MKARIEQDDDPMRPDEWDDAVWLIAGHRDFFVPPEKNRRHFSVQDEIDSHKKTHHVFLLEAYIHSGVVLALAGEGNFPDRMWDVSLLGAVFVDKKETRFHKKAREMAQGKIDEWNQYLSGDVWGVVIEDDNGNHLDSCWGFYGRKYAEEEAARMLEENRKHSFDPAI